MPLSICSSSVGQMVLLKYASNTLCLRKISGAFVFVSNKFNLNVKIGGNFLSFVLSPIIALRLYLTAIFDVPHTGSFFHFIVHLNCNFDVTSNNLRWMQF